MRAVSYPAAPSEWAQVGMAEESVSWLPHTLFCDGHIYIYEQPAISQALETIEDIRRKTDLDPSVEILVKANNRPLIFLESQNGFEQEATVPVLRQTS
jgi:hypothetical protein